MKQPYLPIIHKKQKGQLLSDNTFILSEPVHLQPKKLFLVGESKSGKTTLAQSWGQLNNAYFISSDDLQTSVSQLPQSHFYVIDGVPIAPNETWFFHFYNKIQEEQVHVLWTSEKTPAATQILLPDLRSRLLTFYVISLTPATDNALERLVHYYFQDHGFTIKISLIRRLLVLQERTPLALHRAVCLIAHHLNQTGERLTLATLQKIIET